MRSFFNLILHWPKATLSVIIILALMGWRMATTLPIDVFPDISVPRVVIQTEAGGLSADEVERLVTIPIGSAVNGIPGVTNIRSSSGGGLSFVWIDFDVNTDLARARFDVFERMARITETLPEEVEAEIAPVVSVTGEIMIIALTSQGGVSPLELREIAEYDLRTRLLAIPGIGEVTVMGGLLPECRVHANPERLAVYGLDVNDIVESVSNASTFASAGYLPNVGGNEIPLRQIATVYTTKELEAAILPMASPLRIGDVANVTLAGAPRRGSASYEGSDAVLLSVQKTPGGNTLELTKQVEEILTGFRNELKDRDIAIHHDAYRQADLINASIEGSRSVLCDAILVVVLVLGLTLLQVRTLFIVLLTMPLSVLLGVLLFPVLGIGINVMTLGGFAVAAGDIVDASIIFTEVIWRKLKENDKQASIVSVILSAAYSVIPGVLSSTIAIILVFTPLLMLTGLESRFFKPFALSYLAIFIASFIVSLFAVPTLSRLLWKAPKQKKGQQDAPVQGESIATRVMKKLYSPIVRLALKAPLATVLLSLVICGAIAWRAKDFGSSFLPPFREDSFNAALTLPPGASLDETERVSEACCNAIGKLPGVLSVTRRTGRAERDQHAEPVSNSEFVVRVDLMSDTNQLREQIRAILSAVPGASAQVGYPIAHRISAILSGTEAELAISVYGEDLNVLRAVVAKLKTQLEAMPGVADVQANREITLNTLRIDYNLDALAEAGLTLKSAGEQVALAFNGIETGEIRDGLRRRPIVVRLEEPIDGTSEESVRNLLLHAPDGKFVKLHDVAQIVPEEASNLLLRENGRRRALISCNITADANVGDLVKQMEKTLNPIAETMGCSIAYGGSHSARENAAKSLTTLGAILFVALFILLVFTLGNAKTALVALISIPLGLVGGIFAVDLSGRIVSVPSLIGFVTVAGFTIRNGILLLNRYQEHIQAGIPVNTAIIEGSLERMVPIIMTSLTTVLGLLPIVYAGDTPGGELLAPLAIVQFGGILGAMLLGLIILPAAASLVYRTPKQKTTLALPLLLATCILTGCQNYTPAPIQWQEEIATWEKTPTVTLTTCEDAACLALIGNPELNTLRISAAGSKAIAAATGWWSDPTLDLDIQRVLHATENPFNLGGAIAFTLPLSGVPALEAQTAKAYAKADASDIKATEQSIATDARIAFHTLAMAHKKVTLLRAALNDENYQHALATLQPLAHAGEIPSTTVAELHRANLARHNELKAAEQEHLLASEALRKILGLAPRTHLTLQLSPNTTSCEKCPTTIDDPMTLIQHHQIQALLQRLEADEQALKTEIQRQYPDITLGPSLAREDGHNQIGLIFGIDLPLWNKNKQAIAEATATRDLTRATSIQTWRNLVLDATTAHLTYTTLSNTPPLQQAIDLHALNTLATAGEIEIVDYLETYESLVDMQLSMLEWQTNRAIAQAELNRFTTDRKED